MFKKISLQMVLSRIYFCLNVRRCFHLLTAPLRQPSHKTLFLLLLLIFPKCETKSREKAAKYCTLYLGYIEEVEQFGKIEH